MKSGQYFCLAARHQCMSLCFITYVPFVVIIIVIIYSKGITYLYSIMTKITY